MHRTMVPRGAQCSSNPMCSHCRCPMCAVVHVLGLFRCFQVLCHISSRSARCSPLFSIPQQNLKAHGRQARGGVGGKGGGERVDLPQNSISKGVMHRQGPPRPCVPPIFPMSPAWAASTDAASDPLSLDISPAPASALSVLSRFGLEQTDDTCREGSGGPRPRAVERSWVELSCSLRSGLR